VSFLRLPATDQTAKLPQLGAGHLPLRQVVTNALRQAILGRRLKPGEHLVEERLAAELGVSRNPVREALRVLETEGLVDFSPRQGAFVTEFSGEQAREIVEVRAALEGLCARLATRRCTPAVKVEIDALLARGDQASASDDSEELGRVHAQVHQVVARAGHNRHLSAFVQSLREKTEWLHASSLTWRAKLSWQEHAAVLRAIASGDEELAAFIASRHVAQVGNDSLVRASSTPASAPFPTG
jgi:DNA-binding GntR family transcriptional regulator